MPEKVEARNVVGKVKIGRAQVLIRILTAILIIRILFTIRSVLPERGSH